MRTPRFLLAAAAAALTVTALTGCASEFLTADDSIAAQEQTESAAPVPDGRYNTPLQSNAGGGSYVRANWVRLPDGRKVLCIGSGDGYDCNWDDIRPKDAK
jgi:hypothetical protein